MKIYMACPITYGGHNEAEWVNVSFDSGYLGTPEQRDVKC